MLKTLNTLALSTQSLSENLFGIVMESVSKKNRSIYYWRIPIMRGDLIKNYFFLATLKMIRNWDIYLSLCWKYWHPLRKLFGWTTKCLFAFQSTKILSCPNQILVPSTKVFLNQPNYYKIIASNNFFLKTSKLFFQQNNIFVFLTKQFS